MSHWADKDLELARLRGLLRGDPDGGMRPDHGATRAEIAVISNRLYDLTKESFEHLIPGVDPAVVMVINERPGGGVDSFGSGVSIGGGLVATNAHVVINPDGTVDPAYGVAWHSWAYGQDGNVCYAMADLIQLAEAEDIAILRVGISERGDMPVLPLGDPAAVRRAEPVAVLGSPVGLIGSVSVGVVSYAGRSMTYEIPPGRRVTIADMIQTDAAINPGNSGGAMVNLRGELIGIPSCKLAGLAYEGLGFAIGVRTLREVLEYAGIRLAPKPTMYRPDYERYGWHITPAAHTRPGPVKYLVVHHEGGVTAEGSSALDIHRWYLSRTDDKYAATGYHAHVERDGRIAEGRPLWAVGAHAARKGGPDYNPESLGLCIVGNLDLAPPAEGQLDAAVAWLRWASLLHSTAQVVGHGELPAMATNCPGRGLDMDSLRRRLREGV